MSSSEWVQVSTLEELPPGSVRPVETGSERVALVNVDGQIYAIEDQCSHQDLPLSGGELIGTELECPFHGARFDVCTGRAKCLPAIRPVRTFETEVRDGGIFLKLG